MNRFLMLVAFSLLSLAVASASPIPCSVNTGFDNPVSGTTVVTCDGLTFDNFQVLDATGNTIGAVDILSAGACGNNEVCLSFNPNLLAGSDVDLMFDVWGGVSQIDMSVGGDNASVMERACANPIATTGALAFLCTNSAGTTSVAPLGLITVSSGTPGQPIFSGTFGPVSPVYIFKNILVGPGGQLSEFTQSFQTTVPEPISLVLLGSGLLGLGLLRRRSRKD